MRRFLAITLLLILLLLPFSIILAEETSNTVTFSSKVETIKHVYIWSDAADIIEEGTIVTLYSSLEGFEGYDVHYQWQRMGPSGEPIDIAGANDSTYSFAAAKSNEGWQYRLVVYWGD